MKYYRTLGKWKASNVEFDETFFTAYSYGWWEFVKRLPDGTIVFNNSTYSTTTNRHQAKVVRLLQEQYGIDLYKDALVFKYTKKCLGQSV